ncbi:SH3 domain-containing protein [Terrilactibacillus sp. S3-3]|nr:SH3 domain-containing protein [Terrilactibacillus sp. S3-3]
MDQNRSLLVLGITATATVATMAITPAHADAASQFDSYKGQATVNLNVRSTPSTAKSPLATLKKGTTFEVVGKSGDWLKIKYKKKQSRLCI